MFSTKKLNFFEKRITFQNLHFDQIRLRRFAASIIDISIILGILFITVIALKFFGQDTKALVENSFWIYIFYYGIQLSSIKAATIGMRINNIKIVDKSGKDIWAVACFTLPFITIIGIVLMTTYIMPIVILGYLMTFMNERKRLFRDTISGTVFIRSDLKYLDPA